MSPCHTRSGSNACEQGRCQDHLGKTLVRALMSHRVPSPEETSPLTSVNPGRNIAS